MSWSDRRGMTSGVDGVWRDGGPSSGVESTPVAYSGFMGCVIHSVAVTDRGIFEVGRYPAMNIETFSKVWQWFIHRKVQRDKKE